MELNINKCLLSHNPVSAPTAALVYFQNLCLLIRLIDHASPCSGCRADPCLWVLFTQEEPDRRPGGALHWVMLHGRLIDCRAVVMGTAFAHDRRNWGELLHYLWKTEDKQSLIPSHDSCCMSCKASVLREQIKQAEGKHKAHLCENKAHLSFSLVRLRRQWAGKIILLTPWSDWRWWRCPPWIWRSGMQSFRSLSLPGDFYCAMHGGKKPTRWDRCWQGHCSWTAGDSRAVIYKWISKPHRPLSRG